VLAQLRRLAGGENETVYMARGENHLAFRIGERMLLSRLLESRFPQYERVLVRDNPYKLRLRRQEFTAALRRVALLASERTHGVQLQLDTDSIGLSSVGFDIGSGEEQVECEYRGEAMKVFVNAQYMIDFFNAVSTEWVEMRLRDADGPIVLTPVDDDAEITECLYVIMPIRL
jgi:DNA polymerase-3 subunit beta